MNTYNVEILSHCFCAGAEQAKAEIRVPSIRGLLRWWFRVLGGTPKQEKAVFGGVHQLPGERREDSARASAVRLRIVSPCESTEAVNLAGLGWDVNSGKGYLLWPLRARDRNADPKRGVIRPGKGFSLGVQEQLPTDLKARFTRALRACLLLGALGTRANRGFGSLWPVGGPLAPLNDLGDFIHMINGLELPSEVRVITLSSAKKTPEDALEEAGLWLRSWRAGSTKSVRDVKKWGQNDHDAPIKDAISTIYRPAIGLPLMQRYSENRGMFKTSFEEGDRWASPVHIKLAKLQGGYVPLVVFFPDMALPERSRVDIQEQRGGRHKTLPVSHDLLREMMNPPSDGQIVL